MQYASTIDFAALFFADYLKKQLCSERAIANKQYASTEQQTHAYYGTLCVKLCRNIDRIRAIGRRACLHLSMANAHCQSNKITRKAPDVMCFSGKYRLNCYTQARTRLPPALKRNVTYKSGLRGISVAPIKQADQYSA